MSVIQTRSELRTPPHNAEVEQSVLGTMLLRSDSIPLVMAKITDQDFYREPHRVLFKTMRDLYINSGAFDMVTLADSLQQGDAIQRVGGFAYIAALTSNIPAVSHVEKYCQMLTDKRMLRDMIRLSTEIMDECYEVNDPSVVTDMFGKRFFEIAAGNNDDAQHLSEIMPAVLENLKQRCASDSGMAGVSTGYVDLDRMISGLVKTDLVILAARPAMGKTALAMNIAESVAAHGVGVLVFSLEMGRVQLAERLLSKSSTVRLQSMRKGLLNDSTWPMINTAVGNLSKLPIIIDDTPALSITQIRARSKMLHSRHGIGAIFVDYLQLVRGTGGNREQEIADISRGLKALAKELNVPVVALSQLNRGLESRTDKRPMMSDLRESGAIEQDADTIIFIYRDEVYNKAEDNPMRGIAEIIIGKQRSGPTGTVKLAFDGSCTQFNNLHLEYDHEDERKNMQQEGN